MRSTPLHPAASDPLASRGRRHPERADPARNDFQRDRDRIVHSTAFRRLVYKTQVFLNHEGDLFRTRLTHSLEVAQVARSIARALGLHEDLVEAIALAHDLGHTPFGHAGQDALDKCLKDVAPEGGGFEHNLQSLRVVDRLEQAYVAHDGLNLTFETREGILKHCSRRNAMRIEEVEPGGVARRFLDRTQPSVEAQVCNVADAIAYNTHDIDDGVRSGLVSIEQLAEVEIVRLHLDEVRRERPDARGRALLAETLRRILSVQIRDVTSQTRRRLAVAGVSTPAEVRQAEPMVGHTDAMDRDIAELKRFLRKNLYRHPRVVEQTDAGKEVVRALFEAYIADDAALPPSAEIGTKTPRAVADYIAGMTDRFAAREYRRVTGRDAVRGGGLIGLSDDR